MTGNKSHKNAHKAIKKFHRKTAHTWSGKFWSSNAKREWSAIEQVADWDGSIFKTTLYT